MESREVKDRAAAEFDKMGKWFEEVLDILVSTKQLEAPARETFGGHLSHIILASRSNLAEGLGDITVSIVDQEFGRMRGSLFNTTEMTLPDDLQERFKRQIRTITGASWDAMVKELGGRQPRPGSAKVANG